MPFPNMLAEPRPPPCSSHQRQELRLFQLFSKTRRRRRRCRPPPPDLNDDLMAEILLCLPTKTLFRFRSVSKRWLSVSSHPKFVRSHRLRHRPLSGFFLSTLTLKFTYFPIDPSSPPPSIFHPKLSLPGAEQVSPVIESLHNDLILYREDDDRTPLLHVFNLKTLEHTTLSPPPDKNDHWYRGHTLISYPNHYKVISSGERMHVYDSQTRTWKLLFDPAPMSPTFSAYWEGSLVCVNRCLFRLDVEREVFDTIPLPGDSRGCHYIGESRGQLHLITSSEYETRLNYAHFDVFGMDGLDSGWSVIHHVDLQAINDVYPEVAAVPLSPPPREEEEEEEGGSSGDQNRCLRISVVYFHREDGGKGRGDQLFLSIPGKIVSYNIQDKTFATIADNVVAQNMSVEHCITETEYRHFQFLPHWAPSLSTRC